MNDYSPKELIQNALENAEKFFAGEEGGSTMLSETEMRAMYEAKSKIERMRAFEGYSEGEFHPTLDDFKLCVYNELAKYMKEILANKENGYELCDEGDQEQFLTLYFLGRYLGMLAPIAKDHTEITHSLAFKSDFLTNDIEVSLCDSEASNELPPSKTP